MRIEIEKDDFIRGFSNRKSRIYSRLADSLLTFSPNELPEIANKRDFLENLYSQIVRGAYFPSPPRGYLRENKHNGVPRFVPVLSFSDNLVYTFCIQQLIRESPVERAANTYGGYQMGTAVRIAEEVELEALEEEFDPPSPYRFENSLDPKKWRSIWRAYQRAAYLHSDSDSARFFIHLDIANFYDSVNLDVLERLLRGHVDRKNLAVVDLLFVLLGYWNRAIEGYARKTVGLPLEEIGDNSRILSNFFLLQYDTVVMEYCASCTDGAKYLRFADDQILMAPDRETAEALLFFAANELREIGLSINSGKIVRLGSREDFDHFWCFEQFKAFEAGNFPESLNILASSYFDLVQERETNLSARPCRIDSIFRALLYRIDFSGFDHSYRHALIEELLVGDNLAQVDHIVMQNIRSVITRDQVERFDLKCQEMAMDHRFNRFAFNLARLYGSRKAPDWLSDAIQMHSGRA